MSSDLRALMKAQRAKQAQSKAPPKFAKWTPDGELQCLICQARVTSEVLWPGHLKTPQHLKALNEWQRKAAAKKAAASATEGVPTA